MYRFIYAIIVGFFLGVFFRSFVDLGPLFVLACLVGSGVLAFAYRLLHSKELILGSLVLAAAALGLVRTELALDARIPYPHLRDGEQVTLEGVIRAEPDRRDGYVLVLVSVKQVQGEPAALGVRARLPLYPEVLYGDRVVLTGVVEEPSTFETDTGRTFNYPMYLLKDGIQYTMSDPEVSVRAHNQASPIRYQLFAVKYAWLRAVEGVLVEPLSSLLGGLVVGAKQSLGEVWLTRFRETGIVHIVVLSGFNLTVVADAITRMTAFLPRLAALGAGLTGIVAFALLTGGGATVVRASIMAALALIARHIMRPTSIVRALSIAACIMVLHNPLVLAFDPGFQLSFIATLGLVLGSPMLLPYLWWVPAAGQMREIVTATIATQLAVLPLLLYQIGQLSIVALPVNLLVLPLVPATMLVGFLAGLVALAVPFVAAPFALVAGLMLRYMFWVVELFSRVPFAAVDVPPISAWMLACVYAAMAWYVYRYHATYASVSGSAAEKRLLS